MRSYVSEPELHKAACADPDLLGGQFLDLGGERVDEIQSLIAHTEKQFAPALALAEAIDGAWRILQDYRDGRSLADAYSRIPPAIRGYVELVYSPTGAPDLRLLEPLLYHSPVYNPRLQGALIHQIAESDRSFVLSTPRLDTSESFYLDRPFSDPAFDMLGRLRVQPQTLGSIRDALGLTEAEAEKFQRFLLPDAHRVAASKPAARWRYFGHACVLVETSSGKSVLIDPVIAYASDQLSRDIDQSRRLDGSDAVRAMALVKALNISEVRIYALGLEPWLKFVSSLDHGTDSPAIQQSDILMSECRKIGLSADRLFGRSECLLSEDEVLSF